MNLIYFSNIGFMAMNNMLRALTFFILQVKIFLVQWIWWKFVGETTNLPPDVTILFVCVRNSSYRRNCCGWGQAFSCTSGFHVKPSSNCPDYMSAELGVWKPNSATVPMVWHLRVMSSYS